MNPATPLTSRGFPLGKGRYMSFAAPGVPITLASGLDNRGRIAGIAAATADVATTGGGFVLADGIKGAFTQVNFPGDPATGAAGINDQGQITGSYRRSE
ncbi:hypothetical protein AB5J49_18580 [Streptomyces sp. R28]|uniref:Uncharacterized protein n=1 Tax=Streptomyces sp. R28 TaxID=3238628 RepID=A0AB39PZE1_9ACTN